MLCRLDSSSFWCLYAASVILATDTCISPCMSFMRRSISNALAHDDPYVLCVQLEEALFPVMERMIAQEGEDLFEEILEILSYFTFFSPAISLRLWSLWPKLHAAFNDWALLYLENILIPLDNYISRGTEVFLTSRDPDYLASANQVRLCWRLCQLCFPVSCVAFSVVD